MNALIAKMKKSLGRKPKDTLLASFTEFHQWTPTVWLGSNSIHTFSSLRNLYVASMGLIGETGEVLEALEVDGDGDQLLEKELGDCVYYLSVVAHMFGILPKVLLATTADQVEHALVLKEQVLSQALASATFKLTETLKKYIRDSANYDSAVDRWHPNEAVIQALQGYWRLWIALVEEQGFSVSEIFALNVHKIESRKERGTLRGSGDLR